MFLNKFKIMSFLEQGIEKNKQMVFIMKRTQKGQLCMIKWDRKLIYEERLKGQKYIYCKLTEA